MNYVRPAREKFVIVCFRNSKEMKVNKRKDWLCESASDSIQPDFDSVSDAKCANC